MNTLKYKLGLILFSLLFLLTACKEDNENLMPAGMGEIAFAFSKITVYEIAGLTDIASIMVVMEKDGQIIKVPSLSLDGDDELILSTSSVRYPAGIYKVQSYRIFDYAGALINEVELEVENQVEIMDRERVTFNIPLKFTSVIANGNLKNTLLGLLVETFGKDSTQWPSYVPNWHPDLAFDKWENLGFSYDDYGNIEYLQTIRFDEKFKGMKKIPEFIANLLTLDGIVVENLDLEELPESLGKMGLSSLLLKNTKIKRLPTSIALSKIGSMGIINSEMTEIQDEIGQMPKLMFLTLSGNKITSIPASLLDCENLESFVFSDSEITSLPENIFEKLYRVSTFDLSGNKKLSKLPENIPTGKTHLRGLFLDGCAFTAIPAFARNNSKLRTLRMDNNNISALQFDDIKKMTNLLTLSLNGNPLSIFPKLESNSLLFLSLNYTRLKQLPDLSELPALTKFYCWGNGFSSFPDNYFSANPNMKEARLTAFDTGEFGGYPQP